MQFESRWVDVDECLRAGVPLQLMMQRRRADNPKPWPGPSEQGSLVEHWVYNTDGGKPNFTLVKSGEMVRVPLLSCQTQGRSASSIWALGLHIGMTALEQFYQEARQKPLSAVLALGLQCHDLETENAYRCYVGVAFQTK